ncbi:SAM-dependent methyltransferase [Streptomyces sp. NA04227]|uniref:SAM-dependent methyltransferase n=1 Tax=Streptomyces sp. NA04227 TaxID=2742136 RepID=UPI0015912C09|nr:SAM-dependent methyltransferase [Streptomyces sp. NA04227]QKW07507.1 SAM-dependent methyltransferase [Streptomyces sp. NA04227]
MSQRRESIVTDEVTRPEAAPGTEREPGAHPRPDTETEGDAERDAGRDANRGVSRDTGRDVHRETDIDAVGRTSLLTAAIRAVEHRRADRIHTDPYAESLSGEAGVGLLAEMLDGVQVTEQQLRLLSVGDVIAIRTRYFDDWLQAAAREVPQVVSLASGMDCRAYRLDWPEGLRYFELDRAPVIAYKEDRLADVPPRADHRTVRADLADPDWGKRLLAAGYDPELPSAWLMEGLLYYLPESAVRQVLAQVRDFTTPGSTVGLDLASVDALSGQLDVFNRWGCPWLFGTDRPEEFLASYGFTARVVQPGDPTASYGRWSGPVQPRSAEGARRAFFVEAERRAADQATGRAPLNDSVAVR